MPAYEGEDHWVYFTDMANGDTSYWKWRTHIAAECISRLGRNLAVAGALHAAEYRGYTEGYREGKYAERRGWED